ncbi:MAG: DUF1015 domain-containing protein, partial [Spirochaetaceae bacterium]|nr:DUF1015 domain-containing protein [Spirochaetaceae bacterium]
KKEDFEHLEKAFERLSKKNRTLFAVGDGNHSLAAAKEVWNIIKKKPGIPKDHPSRYALVEIVNINSDGLAFHPIHRVVFDIDSAKMLSAFEKDPLVGGCKINKINCSNVKTPEEANRIIFVSGKNCGEIILKDEANLLAAEKLQIFLDKYLTGIKEEIDYIHGEEDLMQLSEKESNIGFLLPSISKKTFFSRITAKGVYPRKTFSIGEAIEKKYYLEARIIDPALIG